MARRDLGLLSAATASSLAASVGGDGALSAEDGYFLSARAVLSSKQIKAVSGSRTLRASFNRIMRNVARVGVDRLRRLTIPYRTGLFRSGWRIDRVDEVASRDLSTRLVVRNIAPYAVYVHEAGTPRSRTVVKKIVPATISYMKTELRQDLTSGAFARELKTSLLAKSNFARGGR